MKAWQDEVATPRAERRTARPMFWAAGSLVIIGLITLFFFWPLGLAIILVGCLLDRRVWLCGACGNKIEKTSTLCPVCRVQLH